MLTLKEWRRAKGISIAKMAQTCGVSSATYVSWEKDPSKIKIGKAEKISELLGVPIIDIIFLA